MSLFQYHINLHSVFQYAGRFAPVESLQETVSLVMRQHIKSEIIGQWLYCFTTSLIDVQLLAVGFWYNCKHNAYIYSGSLKEGFADEESLSEIRTRFGSQIALGVHHV